MAFRVILFILLFVGQALASMDDEVPIIYRSPSGQGLADFHLQSSARVVYLVDNKTLRAVSTFRDWHVGDVVALESQTPSVGVIGFVEVTGVENKQDGTYEITCELLRQSRLHFVQVGDQLIHLDLSSGNEKYRGTTDLIIKESDRTISAKYRPLFTQGVSVGDTAETLWEDEYLVTWYGQVNYGLKRWLTVNTVVPADLLGAVNVAAKAQLFRSYSNVFATGLSFAKIPNQTSATLNLNLHWDSVSSESVISHTLLTVALFSFEDAADTTAIKSLGTSSFQTGYEFILDNWDRVLMGPSYNFEKKAVGGYLSYLKIWDKFHLSFSLNSTDVASFKFSPVDGYYLLFDAYWRF